MHVFPEEDVRLDLLPPEKITRHDDGFVEIDWDAADEWLEEDEELLGHARDPFHRIDALRTSRHIRVSIGGELVAETRRAADRSSMRADPRTARGALSPCASGPRRGRRPGVVGPGAE